MNSEAERRIIAKVWAEAQEEAQAPDIVDEIELQNGFYNFYSI